MFDPFSQALRAVAAGSGYAFPLVFLAGAVSSIGPCVAPRFIAVAGLASHQERDRAAISVCSFVAGLMAVYGSFGAAASLLGRVAHISTEVYVFVALTLAAGGIVSLWNDPRHTHCTARFSARSWGAAFFLGVSFALVLSPCCTPLVLGILAYTSAAGDPLYGSALLACFALGHALPVFAVATGARGVGVILERLVVRQAASVLSAAMMLALAAYYGVLA